MCVCVCVCVCTCDDYRGHTHAILRAGAGLPLTHREELVHVYVGGTAWR